MDTDPQTAAAAQRPYTGRVNASLRWRVTTWTAVVSLLIELVLGMLVFFYYRYSTDSLISARMAERGQKLANAIAASSESVTDETLSGFIRGQMFVLQVEGYAVGIYSADGTLLAATHRPMPSLAAAGYPQVLDRTPEHIGRHEIPEIHKSREADPSGRLYLRRLPANVTARLVGLPADRSATSRDEQAVLLLATTDSFFEQTMALASQLLLVALAVATLATGLATWLISGVALKPLRRLLPFSQMFMPETIREQRTIDALPSELAQFTKELSIARERLSESLRSEDRLISNLSHEMKTPIAVLLTEAELLDTDRLEPEAQVFVRSVRQEMRRLSGTIETFVVLSRMRGGKTLPQARLCNVNDVVIEAIAACNPVATRRAVIVRADVSSDEQMPTVRGDEELLQSMFGHALRNCINASKAGDEVVISVQTRGGRCLVSARDRGTVVPESILKVLFDRFTDPPHDCNDRRDLGLSVAKGITELHGGTITAHNNADGPGCEFIMDLPLAKPPSATDSGPSDAPGPTL